MIFGNLGDILQEDYIMESVNRNINTNKKNLYYNDNTSSKSVISKLLLKLSNYGMNYSDEVIKNMRAIPADKGLQKSDDILLQNSIFAQPLNPWRIKSEEDKPFNEKQLNNKVAILRKMATQPELEDILDIMANECIVYDDDNSYICQPFLDSALINDLNETSIEEINNCLNKNFYKFYMFLSMKQHAWDIFKKWLIDGVICYQIVYDNVKNPKTILGIIECNPNTLTKEIVDGVTYWYQFKGVLGQEKVLLDSEIIYIKYEDSGVNQRQSYLERLIRPFNIYRIIEQAQVIWTVTQSSFKTMFTIPVGNQSTKNGLQTLASAMNRYKEDISFNSETGEIKVNGKMNLPFNKEYWMPQNENGKPEIQQLVDNGPNLNDSDQLKYFENKLYKMSKIPFSRFDRENQSTWFGTDPTQTLRDEINFSRFVTRLRNSFGEILLKPLRIQLCLSIPNLKNDKRILDAISLQFNSYNQFEEMMDMEILNKRIEFIQNMRDSIIVKENGEDVSYFSPRFLIERYLKLSDADIELNRKYKEEDKLNGNSGGEAPSTDDLMGSEENEENSGSEEIGGEEGNQESGFENNEGGELESEMMGNVQPESPETPQA